MQLAGQDGLDGEVFSSEEGKIVLEAALAGAREPDQEEQRLHLRQIGQRHMDRVVALLRLRR